MTPHNILCKYIFITRVAGLEGLRTDTIDGYGSSHVEMDSPINIVIDQ